MSERLRESLSALMDDEANELELQRVLSSLGEDAELRQTWVRYHAARSAMGGQPVQDLSMDISGRVRDALADPGEGQKTGTFQRMLRPLASFAVAASVAAVVVVGGQQLSQLAEGDTYMAANNQFGGVSAVGFVNSVGATPVRASFGTQGVPVLQPAARTAYRELARQRMQKYMQEHAEHAALNSPQGLVPFARVQEIKE
ncbi:MAG: sigma-E factor negative regulatory protein [Halioglobus sp.]